MKQTIKSKVQTKVLQEIEATKHLRSQTLNPFKDDILCKLIYLIDRQKGIQEVELYQFFNKLSDPEEYTYRDIKVHFKEYAKIWRDRRIPNSTTIKYLNILLNENKPLIEKKVGFGTPITYDPIHNEILPYEVTKDGGHYDKPSKPERYNLKEPLFVLLLRSFNVEDYFTQSYSFEKNKEGFKQLEDLLKQDLEDETTQNDIKKIMGLNNFDKEEIFKKIEFESKLNKMQKVIDITQKKTRKDFLEKLVKDFDEYYNPLRNLNSYLSNIYEKRPLGIDYFSLLTNFLNNRFNFEKEKGISCSKLKDKKYNYPETFLLGYVKIILIYQETGTLIDWSELNSLQKTWTNRDNEKRIIDLEYNKIFNKKLDIKSNSKHSVARLR
jgi:hypothetical protein